jgi:hypothetical protein
MRNKAKKGSKGSKLDNVNGLSQEIRRKSTRTNKKKANDGNMHMNTITSSKKSQRISRYSNVNVAMLNSMKTTESQEGDDMEATLSKQTKLEKRVSMLTIKRTMTCFFAVIFSIPFFISTTYKAYLSEFEPIAKMMDDVYKDQGEVAFYGVLDNFVLNHEDDFDELVGLEAQPDYVWKHPKFAKDEIRELDLIAVTNSDIKFTVNLRKTVTLYAICGV